jgi:hypothetical protein
VVDLPFWKQFPDAREQDAADIGVAGDDQNQKGVVAVERYRILFEF